MKFLTHTFWLIFYSIVVVGAYLYAFVWMFYKTIAKWIRKNDELVADDQEDTDNHLEIISHSRFPENVFLQGCRCLNCNHARLGNEPYGDTETTTEINHNLRNNR